MSIDISAVFISDFKQVFVCNETSYPKVSQSLQMMGNHVTDHLFFEWYSKNHCVSEVPA